jgi:hypothetical protein
MCNLPLTKEENDMNWLKNTLDIMGMMNFGKIANSVEALAVNNLLSNNQQPVIQQSSQQQENDTMDLYGQTIDKITDYLLMLYEGDITHEVFEKKVEDEIKKIDLSLYSLLINLIKNNSTEIEDAKAADDLFDAKVKENNQRFGEINNSILTCISCKRQFFKEYEYCPYCGSKK